MAILELKSVAKSYATGFWGRKRRVLSDLSLEIPKGEVFGLLGHNGAGKTTTMRLILGLVRPDAGSIHLFGAAGGTPPAARARIGYLGDDFGLYPHFTAEETIQFMGELFRLGAKEIAERRARLLKTVGLSTHARVRAKNYSKGMRQRLGIALALLNDPELLILDEPYSGLDPVGRRQLRQLLLDLKSEGRTILMSSHIVSDVEAVCDRIGILRGGSIRKCLALKDIHSQKSAPVEITVSGVDTSLIEKHAAIERVYRNDQVTVLRCNDPSRVRDVIGRAYDQGGNVIEVKPLKFNLEDYLLEELGGVEVSEPQESRVLSREEDIHASAQ
jgi:ABC-2 type transport system ATP-binding protein